MATKTRLGQDFWERHLGQWHKSGKTQIQYCAGEGLNIKTFNRWKLRLTNSKPRKAPASPKGDKKISLIPVRMTRPEPTDASLSCVRDIRIRLDDSQWIVDVPSGVDPGHLANVLRAIAGVAQ